MTARKLFPLALAAALLGAFAQPAAAQPKPALLLPAGSEIGFTTRQMGVPVDGKFSTFSAAITLDPKKPETGNVSLRIHTGSARFGSTELDAEVPKPTWLSAALFPQATFQSSSIKGTGPGRFEVAGKLTIKGAARDITVPMQLAQSGAGTAATSTATGAFTIKRLEFKVGEAEWADTSMLANDVQVRFKLLLSGVAAL